MTERRVDQMEIGFYKLSLAKNAPDVGAIIYIPCPIEMHPEFWQWIDRPWPVRAMINGRDAELWEIGTRVAEKITAAEYQFLIADRAWARKYAPDTPEAKPWMRVENTPRRTTSTDEKPIINIRDIPLDALRP